MQQPPPSADGARAARIPDLGVRALLSRESRWQSWLDVEAALAQAEADLGMIPRDAADEIERKAHLELLDVARIEEGLRRTEHALVPVIWELDRVCDGDAGGYVHWGATTQNITQTGETLLLRRAHGIFLDRLAAILELLAALAERTADDLLPGRTHGQHAVPATFGFKVAVWIDELARHAERLRECEPRLFVAMLGGAAGTFASFGDQGQALQARLAERLGLRPMPVPARTTADHQAEYVLLLAMLAATSSKIAHEVFTLMKQEFGELEEPVAPGLVGSSTMPQKRNPKLSQDIMAAAAQLRAMTTLALEAMQTEHEADRTTSVMMRRAVDDACTLTAEILTRLEVLFTGIRVFPDRMRANLDLSGGLIMSEAIMLELGRQVGRQRAHDAVYDAAQGAAVSGRPFTELLAEDETVRSHLSPEQIDALLDPSRHVGLCAEVARQQSARALDVARSLRHDTAAAPA
jgi:3-carboxy-cis,cis-muconate cycloisomerase